MRRAGSRLGNAARLSLVALVASFALAPLPANAAFPGANGKIAYSSGIYGEDYIFTMNPDGSVVTNLTSSRASHTRDIEPTWTSDGRKIAFWRGTNCNSGCTANSIFVMNRDGSGQVDTGVSGGDPTWSPDGTKLAFSAVRPGDPNGRIYIMNADGTGVSPVTSPDPVGAAWPAWSPDGTKIAFVRLGNTADIYTIAPDGTGLTQLTNNPGTSSFEPNWSPDGTRIAYSSNSDVFVMNADGSGQTDITNYPRDDNNPAWSPDGTKIVFVGNDGTFPSIHVMNADGSARQDLNVIAGWLDWQPIVGAIPSDDIPASAPQVSAAIVPVFRQCGVGANVANAEHAPPLAVDSCAPPAPFSNVARIGAQMQGSATLTAIPGDIVFTNGDQADFSIVVAVSDVRTTSGVDYNPVAGGADMTTKIRLRLTDRNTGYFVPATPTDFDFAIPIDCTPTADPSTGSNCGTNTIADTIMPGLVIERKSTNVQAFRVRIDDAGANGTRGDSDDRIFATQGVFVP